MKSYKSLIIHICGLGNSTPPFKLFEATITPALLYDCESWIGFNVSHAKLLQKFIDDFIRKVMSLADLIPKAMIGQICN